MSLSYRVDQRGKKFNSLEIIDFVPREGKNQYWKCKCDCGNESIVSIAHLRTGHTKTCGKCKWLNKRFGKLVITEYTNKRTTDGHLIVKCLCDCGNIVEKGVDTLSKNKLTQSCGCQTKSKGELIIKKILEDNNVDFQEEYTFENLVGKNNHKLRFDFAIFKNNKLDFLLEFDGRQHYEDVKFYPSTAITQKYDLIKNQYCKNNNIKLVRISYYDEGIIDYDYIMRAAGY